MSAREIVPLLEAAGWVAAKGGHLQFRHPERPGRVTVPAHGSADLAPATLRAIERQSGVALRSKP
jgi:predicted RNA binding protein YcfA (HicA-like mRNA interferase family)